jgi:hypothetical protein
MRRRGWTAPQLFGVHPIHGTVWVDYCGALMIAAAAVLGGDAKRVLFERTSAYRNLPGQERGVPVWDLAAKGG